MIHENTIQAVKKRHRKQASDKQLVAMQLKAQGLSGKEALKRAGYSKSMQRVPKKVFTSTAIVTAVDRFKLQLKDQGLTTEYMAIKFKEWLEKGNYQEQQQAYKLFKEIVLDGDLKTNTSNKEQVTRRVTLEEFLVTDDSKPTQKELEEVEGDISIPEVKPHVSDDAPQADIELTDIEKLEELII